MRNEYSMCEFNFKFIRLHRNPHTVRLQLYVLSLLLYKFSVNTLEFTHKGGDFSVDFLYSNYFKYHTELKKKKTLA